MGGLAEKGGLQFPLAYHYSNSAGKNQTYRQTISKLLLQPQ